MFWNFRLTSSSTPPQATPPYWYLVHWSLVRLIVAGCIAAHLVRWKSKVWTTFAGMDIWTLKNIPLPFTVAWRDILAYKCQYCYIWGRIEAILPSSKHGWLLAIMMDWSTLRFIFADGTQNRHNHCSQLTYLCKKLFFGLVARFTTYCW